MQQARSGGAMIAVEATEAEVAGTLVEGVVVAAVNGPVSVVLAGDADAAETVAAGWRERGRRVTRLTVSHAFHSPTWTTYSTSSARWPSRSTTGRPGFP